MVQSRIHQDCNAASTLWQVLGKVSHTESRRIRLKSTQRGNFCLKEVATLERAYQRTRRLGAKLPRLNLSESCCDLDAQ
jgi:hypothetical protein